MLQMWLFVFWNQRLILMILVTNCHKREILVSFFAFSKYISILLQNFDISIQYLNFSALRSFRKSIANLNIKVFPKIKVQRDLDLERYLIIGLPANQPAQASVRQPAQAKVRQPVKKNKATIPIGARGRKRETIEFRGIVVNPDARKLTQQKSSGSSIQMVRTSANELPSSSESFVPIYYQPGHRTYARVASTPFAKSKNNHRSRGVSYPLPEDPLVLPNVTDTDEHLMTFPFDENFGRLQYDASSDSE